MAMGGSTSSVTDNDGNLSQRTPTPQPPHSSESISHEKSGVLIMKPYTTSTTASVCDGGEHRVCLITGLRTMVRNDARPELDHQVRMLLVVVLCCVAGQSTNKNKSHPSDHYVVGAEKSTLF